MKVVNEGCFLDKDSCWCPQLLQAVRRISGDLGGAVFRAAEVAVEKLEQDSECFSQDPDPTPVEAPQPGQSQEGANQHS